MAWTESLSAMFTSASKENRRPAAYCAGRTLALKGSTEQQGQTEVRYSTWEELGWVAWKWIWSKYSLHVWNYLYVCVMCVVMWFLAGSLHNYVSIIWKDFLRDHSQGSHLSVWKWKHVFHLFCTAGHVGNTNSNRSLLQSNWVKISVEKKVQLSWRSPVGCWVWCCMSLVPALAG